MTGVRPTLTPAEFHSLMRLRAILVGVALELHDRLDSLGVPSERLDREGPLLWEDLAQAAGVGDVTVTPEDVRIARNAIALMDAVLLRRGSK